MERPYHTIHPNDTQALARFLAKSGQALLPMVELIEQSKLAVDELIDVRGRASIEAVLQLSAQTLAGPPRLTRILKMVDHSSICLLIAGTYTPDFATLNWPTLRF